jgi:hypothetical protein
MKILKIVLIVLTTLVGGCFVINWYGFHRMKTGYEVNAKDDAPFLQSMLMDDLGYTGFEHRWLKKAWVNGFQDHTYLFLVEGATNDLRAAIEKATTTEPIQLTFFSTGNYLGPSKPPVWWDSATLDAAEARYFTKDSNFWRFTWVGNRLYIVYVTT